MSLSLFLPTQTSDPLAELRRMLSNSLVSPHTRRAYIRAFNQFFGIVAETGRPVCRTLLMEYRAQMIDHGLCASTINVRLSAIRKLVGEAPQRGAFYGSAGNGQCKALGDVGARHLGSGAIWKQVAGILC